MTTLEMEMALAGHFDWRRHCIVPNVSFGLGLHECDLLVLRPSGYLIEVEIKISLSDLRKDQAKRHGHESNRIKELWFAVPKKLQAPAAELIPERAGLLVCDRAGANAVNPERIVVRTITQAQPNRKALPLSERDIATFYRLGAMRIWGLKGKLIKATRKNP